MTMTWLSVYEALYLEARNCSGQPTWVRITTEIEINYEQECIPVGCVPSAAVAVRGGLHQAPPPSRHPPGAGTPPGTRPPGPGTPPTCGQNSWHTLLKILPCPKIRLHAVINVYSHVTLESPVCLPFRKGWMLPYSCCLYMTLKYIKTRCWPRGNRSFERDRPTTLNWCMTDITLCFALTTL